VNAGLEGATVPMWRRTNATNMFPVGAHAGKVRLAPCMSAELTAAGVLQVLNCAASSMLSLTNDFVVIVQNVCWRRSLQSLAARVSKPDQDSPSMQALHLRTSTVHRCFDASKTYEGADGKWRLASTPDGSQRAAPMVRLYQLAFVVYKVRCS